MISVITPTIRKEGLPLVKKALERQTVEYEWLIGSPFDPEMGIWVKDDFTGGCWTLNRCSNKLVQNAKGDIIVSIQDHTFCTPEALEKFVFYLKDHKDYVISGVGDKYDKVYPERGIKVWVDPRKRNTGQIRACNFNEIEGNFCALHKSAIYDVGGFQENLDFLGYGMDWFCLLQRLNNKGYKFFIDETNESFSETHGRVKDWDSKNLINIKYEVTDVKYI
jgi:hypothetical protein